MNEQYVEKQGDHYWIANSRVSLESIIFAFLDGFSPETIAAEYFHTISLEQVYGAITYYLSHRQEINSYLKDIEAEYNTFQQATQDSEFSKKIAKFRRDLQMA